jgi:hypothetical protein
VPCANSRRRSGCLLPATVIASISQAPTWTGGDGVYQGFVVTVPSEDVVDFGERGQVRNPDDPDMDAVEAVAWWNPSLLPGNPAVRTELLASMDDVQQALAITQPPDDAPAEVAAPVTKSKRPCRCSGECQGSPSAPA